MRFTSHCSGFGTVIEVHIWHAQELKAGEEVELLAVPSRSSLIHHAVVARGIVRGCPGANFHGSVIPKNMVKVTVSFYVDSNPSEVELPIPHEAEDVFYLSESTGYFLLWPVKQVQGLSS